MLSTPTSPPSLAIAVLLAGALIPAGFVAPNAGSANCASGTTLTDLEDRRLRASTPLSGTFSGSELVHVISEDYNASTGPQGYRLNGLDAYVHDLGCETVDVEFKLTTETPDPYPAREPQMAIQFYDGDVNYLGEVVEEDPSGPLAGTMADNARYVVVEMRDGPLISGVDYDQTPPEPYSVEFDLKFLT